MLISFVGMVWKCRRSVDDLGGEMGMLSSWRGSLSANLNSFLQSRDVRSWVTPLCKERNEKRAWVERMKGWIIVIWVGFFFSLSRLFPPVLWVSVFSSSLLNHRFLQFLPIAKFDFSSLCSLRRFNGSQRFTAHTPIQNVTHWQV